MLSVLKRHPFPVVAYFRQSLVLTYAFSRDMLQPLLPPGLVLDTYGEYGFLAIALVQTEALRPSFLHAVLGRSVFLGGYRIFVRLGNRSGALRGLRILRSDTDSLWTVSAGNLFTHYKFRLCEAELRERAGGIEWSIRSPDQNADLRVTANTGSEAERLPEGSPFPTLKEARRFAGPLPYTFDYEPQTHSIIRILGVREQWHPKPVAVAVLQNTFLQQEPFCRAAPILANAFHVHDIAYRWNRGIRRPLEAA